jgi:peptidoglycan/xylan/chitin deacetylase (PgdA/CDA1 family)
VLAYLVINIVGSANICVNYFFHSYCKANTSKKEIAITFDDGPHPEITRKLIKLLDLHNVTATFFCTGINADTHSDIISKMFSNNHIVGNHSFAHSNFFDLMSPARMLKEITDTNEVIKLIIGKTPLLFRPPYGVTNPMLGKAIKNTAMVSIGWSLRSLDTINDSEKVLTKLKDKTKAGDIVLFHDTNPNILTIIEGYLTWLQQNNYKIVSLTDLINIKAYAS